MPVCRLDKLIQIRQFPAVAHPRHARELLAAGDTNAITGWTAGYAVTVPEHRFLLEKLLADLAYEKHGAAYLINGQYGTGKSHLLILLHLLAVLPSAWGPFLGAHRSFTRYAESFSKRRWLLVHFSLDEYPPAIPLEEALRAEVEHACCDAGLQLPEQWKAEARVDTWGALQDMCLANGYTGPLLLLDELSLFLAGKSPTAREADAAFLQFLAGWCTRSGCRLIGATQRQLGDTGALPTHSWRQVEDRFRRFTLSPQQLVDVAHSKLIEQTDPASIRALVVETILPATRALALNFTTEEVLRHWPFHPAALPLLVKVVNAHLSPHRGVIETLQRLHEVKYLERPASQLITAVELYRLIEDDLLSFHAEYRLWPALTQLRNCAVDAPDPALAAELLHTLALLQLADSSMTVAELRELLFNGVAAPEIADISVNLHYLRRHAPYLSVTRDADPRAERFCLAADDDIGAQARAHMEERRQTFAIDDPRPLETAIAACIDPAWPFASLADNRLTVLWNGVPRTVNTLLSPTLTAANSARAVEGLLAGNCDAQVLLCWPGTAGEDILTDNCPPSYAGVIALWIPRPPQRAERELWSEFTAWRLTADDPLPATGTRERRIRARAAECATELQLAVAASIKAIYLEGQWRNGRGEVTALRPAEKMLDLLAQQLAAGFDTLFPDYPANAIVPPPRTVVQPIITQFITPRAVELPPQSLLGDYLERFALPLGIVSFTGNHAQLTPPAGNIQAMLNAVLVDYPRRIDDAARALGRPPLGLSPEQGRLVVLAAVRTGTLRGLDALMQPTPSDSRCDDIIYCSLPEDLDARFTPLLEQLTEFWCLAVSSPAARPTAVENALHAWLRQMDERLPALRQQLGDWSEQLGVMPWGWTNTERQLTTLDALQRATTFTGQLEILLDDATLLTDIAAACDAGDWWAAHTAQLRVLFSTAETVEFAGEIHELRTILATGEASISQLAQTDAHAASAWGRYADTYHAWHESIFGMGTINALRAVFQSTGFQLVKRLAQLPVENSAAQRCLAALEHARAGYCPGVFTDFATIGICSRCRLPLSSPTPLPTAVQITAEVTEALQSYAAQFAAGNWAAEIRTRLPHAAPDIASRVTALLAWHPDMGTDTLLATVDDAVLTWLLQPNRPALNRSLPELANRLRGQQLTLGEARRTLLHWLDPSGELTDDDVMDFE